MYRTLMMVNPGRWHSLLGALALVAATAPVALAQCRDGTPPPCRAARRALSRVQVLAFDSPDTSYTYLASGLAEDIRAGLLGTHEVVVVGPHAVRALADYVL